MITLHWPQIIVALFQAAAFGQIIMHFGQQKKPDKYDGGDLLGRILFVIPPASGAAHADRLDADWTVSAAYHGNPRQSVGGNILSPPRRTNPLDFAYFLPPTVAQFTDSRPEPKAAGRFDSKD